MFKKAFLNKNVLSNFLKLSMFGTLLTSRGKLFHKFGAATIKYLSPNVLYVLKITYLSKIPFRLARGRGWALLELTDALLIQGYFCVRTEDCMITRSTPPSHLFKGQITKHITLKGLLIFFQEGPKQQTHNSSGTNLAKHFFCVC